MSYSLVAVSGGSDSMALLDILRKQNRKLIVCHVNYGFRESALRDQQIVENYCARYNLKIEILNNINYDKKDGNKENYARVVRYNFFKEMYKKYNCDYLYVGHNLDDLIETYLIQKRRNSKCDYYGLKEENNMYEMKIKRILLKKSKQELKEYCENNNIEYGVDETNFDKSYLRNEIRHDIVCKMEKEEKDKIVEEIEILNKEKEKLYQDTHNLLKKCMLGNNIIDLTIFSKLNDKEKIGVLYYFIIENVRKKISISNNRLEDIIKKINSSKPNIVLGSFDKYDLYKEYKSLVIKIKEKEFSYIIDDLNSNLEDFYISHEGKKLERVVVSKRDFPLKIENYKGGNKDINRLFIEKKVPLSERKRWPIVYDKIGSVLLVLGLKKFYNNLNSNDDKIEFYIKKKEKEMFQ